MSRYEEIKNAYKSLGGESFTPPYETADSLRSRLGELYAQAAVETVEAMASFVCRKEEGSRGIV